MKPADLDHLHCFQKGTQDFKIMHAHSVVIRSNMVNSKYNSFKIYKYFIKYLD